MKTKEEIYQELDAIIYRAIKDPEADHRFLFWDGKHLIDELYKNHKVNLLTNFMEAVKRWPSGKRELIC